jgi:maltooligosyltrehalose trehalohydrolase
MTPKATLGAININRKECHFRVWAPSVDKVEVHIVSKTERIEPLKKDAKGYHSAIIGSIQPGSRYYYRLNGKNEYPDPASRFQPEGVHGPSQVSSPKFLWEDNGWLGIPLEDYIIYELHIGSFTPGGTFHDVIPLLDDLKNLGITALEIMPVSQFPGEHNWGYDGVFPFAVQSSYGGPESFKKLVNVCHKKGIAVILDVVYNHLGPEGNYFEKYGPYFTDRYKTPWGKAINFDGTFNDEVRNYFIENALYWITEFHIDALRLDALHTILDMSASPFLTELSAAVKNVREGANRHIYLIGESDANDRRVVLSSDIAGYAIDAQWNEDFHHALHAILTGERDGYYADFGKIDHLAKAFREGFVYSGQYSVYRRRRHGSSSRDIPAGRFVVFIQNHDQIGNRSLGERLNHLASFEKLKLAAGMVILSPFIPLIFMGEEYAETAPFYYFVDHSNPALIESVRQGRQREFSSFPKQGAAPDPQDEATFLASKLNHALTRQGQHQVLFEVYAELLRLRKGIPALACLSKNDQDVIGYEDTKLLYVHRWHESSHIILVCNFGDQESNPSIPAPEGRWKKEFDSEENRWLGGGNTTAEQIISRGEIKLTFEPNSFLLLARNSMEE